MATAHCTSSLEPSAQPRASAVLFPQHPVRPPFLLFEIIPLSTHTTVANRPWIYATAPPTIPLISLPTMISTSLPLLLSLHVSLPTLPNYASPKSSMTFALVHPPTEARISHDLTVEAHVLRHFCFTLSMAETHILRDFCCALSAVETHIPRDLTAEVHILRDICRTLSAAETHILRDFCSTLSLVKTRILCDFCCAPPFYRSSYPP